MFKIQIDSLVHREFGGGDLPSPFELLEIFASGLTDQSWHNDEAPSFATEADMDKYEGRRRLWVEDREAANRFQVTGREGQLLHHGNCLEDALAVYTNGGE